MTVFALELPLLAPIVDSQSRFTLIMTYLYKPFKIQKTGQKLASLKYKPDNEPMRYLLLSFFFSLTFCLAAPATEQAFTTTQSQAIAQFMPSKMPLVYAENPDYQQGSISLGRSHKRAFNFLKLQYYKATRPMGTLLMIEHRSNQQAIQQCPRKFDAKTIQHPQLGTLLSCIQQRNTSASLYLYPQQIPQEIEIVFTGPQQEMAEAVKSLKLRRLPAARQHGTPSYGQFYTQPIMQLKHPEYKLRSSQLVWLPKKPQPRLIFGYHRAVPFIDKGVTQHMQVTVSHYPTKPPRSRCLAPKTTKQVQHPGFGAYRLCLQNQSTQAYAGARDQSPIHSVLFSATPEQDNRMAHVDIRLHSLAGEELQLLHSLK